MKGIAAPLGFVIAAVAIGLLLAGGKAGAQNGASSPAASPKFSEFAPVEDLSYELNFLIADAEKAVADKEEYDSQIDNRFVRDGNTIALVATALALHDQDNAVKPHAAAIVAAAGKLRAAKDYDSTKKAVEDLKSALEGSGGGEPRWSKISAFKSLMKDEVENINTKLKAGVDHIVKKPGKDIAKRTKDAAANAAMMALIAENAKLYLAETKKPTEGRQWNAFADQFRAAAANVAAKVHAGDKTGIEAGMEKLNQSCNDCHAVFNPEANPVK
jgi:hypothetical protein